MNRIFVRTVSKLNLMSSALIILILTVCFLSVFSYAHFKNYSLYEAGIRNQFYLSKKSFLKNAVQRTLADIEHERLSWSRTTAGSDIPDGHPPQVRLSPTELKEHIKDMIRRTQLIDGGYIRVNGIIDYRGGKDYAVRLVHPDRVDAEGMKLSTDMTDTKGNTPYLTELEGIKKDGEIFFEYWSEKKDSNTISRKLKFAKLYKPYDWIVSAGAYIDEIEDAATVQLKEIRAAFIRRIVKMSIIGIFASVMAFLIARRYQKRISGLAKAYEQQVKTDRRIIQEQNITLRSRVRERNRQINESEKRYQRLFDEAPVPLWEEDFTAVFDYFDKLRQKGIHDFRTYFNTYPSEVEFCARLVNITDVNKETLVLHGVEAKETLLGNLTKLITQEAVELFKEELISLASGRNHFEAKGTIQTLSGESRHVFFKLIVDSSQPHATTALLATIDITKIKQAEIALRNSEEKFKTLYEKAPLSYQSLDENGTIIEVNDTWLAVLGYERHQVIGRHFSRFLHSEWKAHFKEQFPRFKAIGEVLGAEFEMVKKDGSRILVSFHGKISRIAGSNSIKTHCLFRDITTEKQLLREKQQLEAHLRQVQKMEAIGNLAGGIAHDFNNILFPLIGYTEMIREDLAPDNPLQKNVDKVLTAAFRAKELVRQILTVSRQNEQELKVVSLQTIINEALHLLTPSIPKTIEIKTEIDPDCGRVFGDPTQIHQVIMNLSTNAYHAMEETGGTLTIGLEQQAIDSGSAPGSQHHLPPGAYGKLTVSDTGAGISADVMEKIFDPYYTTKGIGKGTGLGLSVVRGIVKGMQGDIRMESSPGKGTRVQVYLPIIDLSSEEPAIGTVDKAQSGSERILLVDDEKAVVDMVETMLTRSGYRVISFTNSPEALEAFQQNPDQFDLVVSDLTMPRMTGLLLSGKIKEIRPHIPVILCTGYSDPAQEIELDHSEFAAVIEKPVIRDEFTQTVRTVLDRFSPQSFDKESGS